MNHGIKPKEETQGGGTYIVSLVTRILRFNSQSTIHCDVMTKVGYSKNFGRS